jgi:hypothetical protein
MQEIISVFCYGCKTYKSPNLFERIPTRGSSGPYRCSDCGNLHELSVNDCPGCGSPLDRKGILCSLCFKLTRTHARTRLTPSETKKCQKCLHSLPIAEFGVTVRRSDGHNNLCRTCHMEGVHSALAKMQANAPGKFRGDSILRSQEYRVEKLGRKSQTITSEHLSNLWSSQDGNCYWCKKSMNPFDDCTLEHIKSLANGGTHSIENLALACNRCNLTRNKDKQLALSLYLNTMFSKEN